MDGRLAGALALAAALHLAALWYTEVWVPGLAGPGALVDAGFLVLPEAPRGFGELIPYALLLALLRALVFLPETPGALRRFVSQAAGLMGARALCIAATALPPSFEGCRAGPLAVLHGGCRDKVFSGHAAYTALMALHLREAYEGSPSALRGAALAALVALEAAYLVAAREHYSVDVLVALLVAALTFRAFRGPRPEGGSSGAV